MLVLAPSGILVYYGEAKHAITFFSNATSKFDDSKSSGDFIIDCLGGAEGNELQDQRVVTNENDGSTQTVMHEREVPANPPLTTANELDNHAPVDSHPADFDGDMASDIQTTNSTDDHDLSDNQIPVDHLVVEQSRNNSISKSPMDIAESFQNSSFGIQLSSSLAPIFRRNETDAEDSIMSERNASWIPSWCRRSSNNVSYARLSQVDGDIELQSMVNGRSQPSVEAFSSYSATFHVDQVLAIFARRFSAFMLNSGKASLYLYGQIIVVGVVVSWTFSYKVATEIELPYQVLMLISLISLYAMIIQYLLLTPEYMVERQTIIRDVMAGYVSVRAYIVALMLTDIPRGMMHSFMLGIILYTIHPLNPNLISIGFAAVCLMIGVSSWQGLIAICSVVTDSISVAYSVVFLVLSSGTLFGGLLVRVEKIPRMFKIFYHISVAAVTQRALITNDMQCCYLTTTCNSIANDLRSSEDTHEPSIFSRVNATTTFCPPGLEYTGDGSDIGNLGRCYLMVSCWFSINFSNITYSIDYTGIRIGGRSPSVLTDCSHCYEYYFSGNCGIYFEIQTGIQRRFNKGFRYA